MKNLKIFLKKTSHFDALGVKYAAGSNCICNYGSCHVKCNSACSDHWMYQKQDSSSGSGVLGAVDAVPEV